MDRKTIDRWLVGESWVGSSIPNQLVELCVHIGERWASSSAERQAAAYITGRFDAYGLGNARQDEFALHTWEYELARGTVTPGGLDLDLKPFHFCPPCSIDCPVVNAGYGTPDDLAAVQDALPGAAAIMNLAFEPFTLPRPLCQRLDELASRGAAAAIVVESKSGRRLEYHNGTDWRQAQPSQLPLPTVTTSREHGTELRRLTAANLAADRVTVRLEVKSREFQGTGINTVATLEGQRWPQETLVLGAHHDTVRGTMGGNDNGSGVCVTLDTARVLAALKQELGQGPGRSIVFTTWSAEEQGLQGAQAFVDKYCSREATPPRLVINLDELATGGIKGLVLAFPHLRSFLQREMDQLADGYQCHVMSQLDVSSDHFPFLRRGIDAAHCWRWRFHGRHPDANFHHEPGDTYDKVRPKELQEYVAFLARLLFHLSWVSPDEWPRNPVTLEAVAQRLEDERGQVVRVM